MWSCSTFLRSGFYCRISSPSFPPQPPGPHRLSCRDSPALLGNASSRKARRNLPLTCQSRRDIFPCAIRSFSTDGPLPEMVIHAPFPPYSLVLSFFSQLTILRSFSIYDYRRCTIVPGPLFLAYSVSEGTSNESHQRNLWFSVQEMLPQSDPIPRRADDHLFSLST